MVVMIFRSHKPRYHHEEKLVYLATLMFCAKPGLPNYERVCECRHRHRHDQLICCAQSGIFILGDSSPNLLICYDPEKCAHILCSTRRQIFSSCVQANSREGTGGAQPMAAMSKDSRKT